MRLFVRRRLIGLSAVATAALAIAVANHLLWLAFRRPAYHTGWLLLAMILFLTLFNLRKKASFLPLGSAKLWLQWHIYVGLLSICVFLVHTSSRLPTGVFETTLAAAFAVVALSGIAGLLASRVFARRMSARTGEIVWERIPRARGVLARRAERLALNHQAETGSDAVAIFYLNRLRGFFSGPRNLWAHLVNSARPITALLDEVDAQRQYCADADKVVFDDLTKLVRAKDDLDYHYALQSVLKYWLFVHVALTYALVLLSLAHLVLVHIY